MADLIIFLILMALGYGFGQLYEKRHYKSIRKREQEMQDILLVQSKIIPTAIITGNDSFLVNGNVVISVDYYKRFVAGLRNLIGGRVTPYETLIDRARREAILRMKEEARDSGAKTIMNVKYEMCSIYKGRRNQIGSVEVLAYGTAFTPEMVTGTTVETNTEANTRTTTEALPAGA